MSWSDLFDSAADTVEGWFGGGDGEAVPEVVANQELSSYKPQQSQLSAADVADIDGGAKAPPVAKASSNWWEKPLKQIMPQLVGASLKQQPQQRAPVAPSGHGVNASTSGLMKPLDELRSTANNNPLADITKWSNLF